MRGTVQCGVQWEKRKAAPRESCVYVQWVVTGVRGSAAGKLLTPASASVLRQAEYSGRHVQQKQQRRSLDVNLQERHKEECRAS
jgi:hypothetical protein